jgi:hypothetical protein
MGSTNEDTGSLSYKDQVMGARRGAAELAEPKTCVQVGPLRDAGVIIGRGARPLHLLSRSPNSPDIVTTSSARNCMRVEKRAQAQLRESACQIHRAAGYASRALAIDRLEVSVSFIVLCAIGRPEATLPPPGGAVPAGTRSAL